jgi:hypothetical protein
MHFVGVLLLATLAWSCENNEAPVATEGEIVLRFEPAPTSLAPGMRASVFDSVVVNVFRSGSPLRLEASHGVAITNDNPITIPVSCIAENNKKVAVDLYAGRLLAYHGANPDVDVAADKATAVNVDVSKFFVSDLTLTPQVIPNGAAFTLRWPSAPAAANYRVEESATFDFATIASSQSVPDTTVDVHFTPGSHYFRVRPVTPYAQGVSSPERFGYVTNGSNQVKVLGVSDAVIPLETVTITGENLDFPDTHALIGTDTLSVESVAWGQIVARVPKRAVTAKVTVSSSLGSDMSSNEVVVQRVAYVNATGQFGDGYINLLTQHADDFGLSGVVSVPVTELDTRDMSVFDIIIVAPDTGTLRTNWGGGQPGRAAVIENSNANVFAMGKGGSIFLSLVSNDAAVTTTTATDADKKYFEGDTGDAIFNTPHTVGGQEFTICTTPTVSVSLGISNAPAGVNLYASTGKTCNILGICSPDNHWALADFRFNDPDGTPVVYFFWGYASDPVALSKAGSDCLGNIMNMLFKSVANVD